MVDLFICNTYPVDKQVTGQMSHQWVVLRFLSILFFLTVMPAQAQPECRLSIRGKVTHAVNEPLPGAVVYIAELQKGAVADEKGNYTLGNICPGRYTLLGRFVGHHTDSVVITVSRSGVRQDFHLQEMPETLESITIHGNRETEPTSMTYQTLQGNQLARLQGPSLSEMLKTLPGLNSIQTGPNISKPVIHGLHSNRVLILNNGIRQEGQQWGSEHAPEIDPFVAKRITVIKGAASIRYGADAIGGVILIEPEPVPRSSTISGEFNLLGMSNNRQATVSGLVEGGIKKWKDFGWRLQSTYKKAGTTRTPDYYLTNTQFEEQNFSASAGYQGDQYGLTAFFSRFNTQIGIFSGAHIGNLTDMENAIRAERPQVLSQFSYQIGKPYQDVSHNLLKANAYYVSPALGKFSLIFGYQHNLREEYDLHRGLAGEPSTRFRLYTSTYELLWEHKPIRRNIAGTIGVSTIYQGNDVGGRRLLIPNFNNLGMGFFAIERWARNRWQVEAGLRYDYRHLNVYYRPRGNASVVIAPQYTYTSFSSSLGAVYQPRTDVTLQLNIGSAWRPPTAAELYSDGIHHGAASYEKGDSTLRTEQSYQANFSVNWSLNDKLTIEAGAYYNHMDDFIYLQPDSLPRLTITGAFPAYTYTQVNAVFRGVDATVKYNFLPGFYWQGKVALVRATNQTRREFLSFVPADRLENVLRYEKSRWKRLTALYLSVSTVNVFQQRRVPPVFTRTTELAGVLRTVYINDFSAPPTGYMLWNAEAGFSFRVGRYKTDVGIIGQNLTNMRYRDYLNRFRYFADEMGRNITLRLKLNF